jgi:hypothetical protein
LLIIETRRLNPLPCPSVGLAHHKQLSVIRGEKSGAGIGYNAGVLPIIDSAQEPNHKSIIADS